MPVTKKITEFFTSQDGVDARRQLTQLANDPHFHTPDSFTSDNTTYPNNMRPFVEKHMDYLSTHPQVNIQTYVANLRLMTRSRR